MKISSWNVAGIKARANDIEKLMQDHQPDIVCLQKTRTDKAPDFDGYRVYIDCADRWSGVATYLRSGFDCKFIVSDSHHIILEFNEFVLINAYVPYSNPKVPGSVDRRKEWDKWIVEFVKKQIKPVIICGDMNIVHTDMDSFYPSCVRNTGCYYQWERDDFNRLLSECKLFDTFRKLHPEERAYTYFDTLHGIDYRASNQGTRLDYFLVSESLMPCVMKSEILSPLSSPSNPISMVLSDNNEREYIKDQLTKFAFKYLDGDINNLLSFPLTKLMNDNDFGCPGRSFDPDNTELMRLIYVALFSDVWPRLSISALQSSEYRGDTLNTYNTLFGRPNENSVHPGIDRFNPSSDLMAKVTDFHKNHFPTIGNMIVLPNLRVGTKSINIYRGCHPKWRDFFDRFLTELKKVLLNMHGMDTGLNELVKQNKTYFNPFFGEHGFDTLIRSLFLNGYTSSRYRSKAYYFWKKGLDGNDYCNEAVKYIDFANAIIEDRGKRMIDCLKRFIGQ